MKKYHVTWEIDVEAETPKKAAQEALRIQRDPDSLATVFDVECRRSKTVRVDLDKMRAL